MTDIGLDQLVNLLSKDDKVKLLQQQLHMKPCVDIETFLTDPYYYGNITGYNSSGRRKIYDVWFNRLKDEVYPNPITTKSSWVVNKGAIGTGKSTCAKAMMAYDIYKITRMENPWDFFELMDKPIIFIIYNVRKWKAQMQIDELWEDMNKSPYFLEQWNNPDSNIHRIQLLAAGKVDDFISNDVFSAMLSELNFAPPWVASDIVDTAISRIESRFQKGLGLFNHCILDCSDTDLNSPVEYFCKYSPYAKNALIFTTSIWQAKPQFYFHKGSFKVYAGSSKVKAHVMTDYEDTRELDEDRIFEAPMELYDLAVSNIDKFLQEKAGRAIVSTDQFLDLDKLVPSFQIEKSYDDIAWVDFYDPNETYIELLKEAIEQLPTDRQIFGRLDLGVSNDRCGFAVGYVENLNSKMYDGTIQYDPDMRIPIAIGFSRLQGQETAINKLIDLILYIHDKHPFFSFTTDTYQSTQIRQTLKLNKINNYALSVDRSDEPYIAFKNAIYRGKVLLPKNRVLQNELAHLKYENGKVDHPSLMDASGEEGTNSKDIADACAGIVCEMSKATEEVMELPVSNNPTILDDYTKVISDMIEQKTKELFINQYINPYQGM